jgi:hypothetical protein
MATFSDQIRRPATSLPSPVPDLAAAPADRVEEARNRRRSGGLRRKRALQGSARVSMRRTGSCARAGLLRTTLRRRNRALHGSGSWMGGDLRAGAAPGGGRAAPLQAVLRGSRSKRGRAGSCAQEVEERRGLRRFGLGIALVFSTRGLLCSRQASSRKPRPVCNRAARAHAGGRGGMSKGACGLP